MADDMDAFVAEVREFLEANAERRTTAAAEVEWGVGEDRIAYFRDDPPDVDARKVAAAKDWQRRRFEAGLGWITGPERYGGRELTPVHDLVYDGLEAEYDVPDTGVLSLIGLGMIGPTILRHGQEAVKDRYLPLMYKGEIIACQLFSEPAAGSDLASLETTAVRDGAGWRLNGQKVWTSVAQHSQIGMALCRELAVARFDVFGRHDVRRRTVAERVPPLPRIRQGLEALKRALHHVARSPPGDAAQGFDGLADRPGCCPRPVTIRRR